MNKEPIEQDRPSERERFERHLFFIFINGYKHVGFRSDFSRDDYLHIQAHAASLETQLKEQEAALRAQRESFQRIQLAVVGNRQLFSHAPSAYVSYHDVEVPPHITNQTERHYARVEGHIEGTRRKSDEKVAAVGKEGKSIEEHISELGALLDQKQSVPKTRYLYVTRTLLHDWMEVQSQLRAIANCKMWLDAALASRD
jgi:hypothetical protein